MELELEPLNLLSDNERPFVIAGPCSAESEEQVMTTAKHEPVCGNPVPSQAVSKDTANQPLCGCSR